MPKPTGKIKLNGLHGQQSVQAAQGQSSTSAPVIQSRSSIFPGGPLLWLLMGLGLGLVVWLGGRTYLKQVLAQRLSAAQSEQVALQSIDALLRLDANATVEVSRGLAHPEFMVANAAFRALGGQLEAWQKLDPAARLERVKQVVVQLQLIPEDIDQDHRILISGLASRIYADTLSNRESGAAEVLEGCRRVIAKSDPAAVGARLAQLPQATVGPDLIRSHTDDSPVPPPLPPLERDSAETTGATQLSDSPDNAEFQDHEVSMSSSMPRLDTGESSRRTPSRQAAMQLTARPISISDQNDDRLVELESQSLETRREPTLAKDASSRSRVIPSKVVPLTDEPTAQELAEQEAVTISGMDQLSIDQLVRLLSSLQPRISQAAALALRSRGMTENNLATAVKLASGSAEVRNDLLSQLVTRDDIDPRPWLLWMATDGQDEVRQHAVGLLQPLADNEVRRQLRLLLNKERNEQVAATIRKVLTTER